MKIIPFTSQNVNPSSLPPALACAAVPAKGVGTSQRGADPISCPPQLVNRSIDTLEINYKVKYFGVNDLWRNLYCKREVLRQSSKPEIEFSFTRSDNYGFCLKRSGSKYFPYVLQSGDIFLSLANRETTSTIANLSLKIGSITCQGDLPQFFRMFRNFLWETGIQIVEEKISRVDFCADFAVSLASTHIEENDKQITRANHLNVYHERRKLTGATIGKGSILCRVYDKIQEMKNSQDAVKWLFFKDKWDSSGVEYTDVTRVEFQLRRQYLKEISVDDFSQLITKTQSIWSYLTQDWLRLASRSVDRENRNQDKMPVSSFWLMVQSAYEKEISVVRQKVKNFCNIPALGKQIRGCMTSILASVGFMDVDYWGMMETSNRFFNEMMSEYLCDPEFLIKFRTKQNKFCPAL